MRAVTTHLQWRGQTERFFGFNITILVIVLYCAKSLPSFLTL